MRRRFASSFALVLKRILAGWRCSIAKSVERCSLREEVRRRQWPPPRC
ncbi:hypothetical protein HMPREF9946_02519 [Acetobacteraceae bacterium AT-5844]|nr:hypothetical protein HMPREF9946_02519 [Acetobacteraceae bacterium AT-5844]